MKPRHKIASFIAAIGCSVLPASAADRYWDGTDNTADADGGNGTWNTSSTNWDTAATGGTDAAFTNGDNVFFGGAAGTVTLGGPITVGNLTFDTAGYTITGSTLTLSSSAIAANQNLTISSAIANAGSSTINGAGTVTLSGNISGAGTLTHSGSALLTLTVAGGDRTNNNALAGSGSIRVAGSGSFYGLFGNLSGLSGTVTMAGLIQNRESALGSASAAFVQESGGTWLVSNDDIASLNVTYNMGSLSGSGTLAGSGYVGARSGLKTLSIGAINTDTTYSGTIINGFSGGGSTVALTKVGTGTLTLSGTNTYTGGTTVNQGILQIGTGTGTAGVLPGNALVNSNGTLRFNYGGTGVVYGGQLSGTGAVIVTGTNNDLQLSGDNSGFTGTFTVDGSSAQLRMRNNNAISGASLVLANGGAVSVFSYVSDHNITVGSLASSDSSTWVRVGSTNNRGLIVGSNNQSTTFAGVIRNDAGGSGFVTKTGTGTLTLTGTNNYSGTTTISAGTLQIGDGGTTGTLGTAGVTNNSALAFNRSDSSSVANVITGTGTLTKLGAGTLTLSGANAYTGGTTVNEGNLVISNAQNFDSGNARGGDLTIAAGATLDATAVFVLGGNATNSILTVNGTLNSTAAQYFKTINMTGGTINTSVTGSDRFRPVASGTTINTFASATSSTIAMPSGTFGITLDVGPVTFNVEDGSAASDLTVSAPIDGANSVTKSGAGVMTLTGANTYNGATTISTGTLQIGNGGTTGTLGSGSVTNDAALVFNRSNDISVANAISGTGSLTQLGGGKLTLGGTNTYTGATAVSNGTLEISDSGSIISNVTVASGATLGGTGTAADTVAVSGSIAPGTSGIGTLSTGAVTWNAGNPWKFDLSTTNNSSDLLAITGAFGKGTGSGFSFDFMGISPKWGETFTLVTFGSTTFSLSDFNLAASMATLGAGSYSTSFFTLNPTSLQFTAVPEPSAAMAGLLLGLGLLRRRRTC